MEFFMQSDKQNTGGFPSNDKSADEQKSPNNETGNQNPGIEINRKTIRSDKPEQA